MVEFAPPVPILNCDICGRQIHAKPNRIVVEGAVMMACESCARHGTPYQEPKAVAPFPLVPTMKPRSVISRRPIARLPTDRRAPREVQELDLADSYPQIIQKGRKKHGLSQEDLAMKVKERLSIIQKIELGKMTPDLRLARTLEHVLRVKLLVPRTEPPVPKLPASATKELTLADIAKIRKREEKGTGELKAQS